MLLSQSIAAKDLAKKYQVQIIGNEDAVIGAVNEIHKLTHDSITYVDHPKYYDKVLNSKACAIIINKKVECPEGKVLFIAEDPFALYNQIALDARPFRPTTGNIASTASIGENTVIQANVFIGNHVKIGKNCIIHANVSIYDYSEIGDNVIIHANTVIGSDAFYFNRKNSEYRKMHTIGRAIVQDNVEIGASVTIDSGVSGDTIIGNGTKIDNQVHIGHGTVVGAHCLFAAQVAIAGKSHIGNQVILYGKVGVSKDISIGDNAVVLASSNVSKSLDGDATYFGSPAIIAREKWKEMAYVRKLGKIWDKLNDLTKNN